jgi:hypothetical protein
MTYKKLSLSALLLVNLTTSFTAFSLSDAATAEAYQGKDADWKYIENKFVVEPANKLASQIQKARAIALVTAACALLSTKIDAIKQVTFDASTLKMDLTTISAAVLGLIGFESYANYLDSSIKHDILVKFLKNWNFHKQYVPTSLIPAFDELATAFNASTAQTFSDEQVNQIFEVIRHLVEHSFAARYKAKEEKSEGLISMFKTLTDISKNLAPNAGK